MKTTAFFWQRAARDCVVILLAISLSGLPFTTRCGWALSISDEKALGKKVLDQVRERMPLIEDGETLTFVQSVGNRIVKVIGTTLYDYQFFIIDRPDINAFAVPGGYVFLYRGLIEILHDEGEMASIIGHELAHIQARHVERATQQGRVLNIATILGVLAGAFLGLGGNAASAIMMGSVAGAQSAQLKYSRENEEEADELGFRFVCDAGYDPVNIVNAMQALNQQRFPSSKGVPSYLSTHPDTAERIQYLQTMVREYHKKNPTAKKKQASPSEEFAFVRAALVSEYSDPDKAMERLKSELQQGNDAATYGIGRLLLRQGHTEQAIEYLQNSASRHPNSPLVLSTLGSAYYRAGRLSEAERVLKSALLLDPASTSARLRLALVYKDQSRNDEALKNLQQIEKFAPTFPDIDYHLGVLLGQMNQLGLAHYYLGRYHQHHRDGKTAIFHYSKAKVLLKGEPEKLKEIETELKELDKKSKKKLADSRSERS